MKKPQSNKASQLLPKNGNLADYLTNMSNESFMAFPGKAEWRKRLIHTLCHWLYTTDSLELVDFLFEYRIPQRTFDNWRKSHEDIRDAVNAVKIFIAARRRTGVMRKKLDGFYAYKNMHEYDPEWHKVDEYHNKLKIDVQKESKPEFINQGSPFVVTRCLGDCNSSEENIDHKE